LSTEPLGHSYHSGNYSSFLPDAIFSEADRFHEREREFAGGSEDGVADEAEGSFWLPETSFTPSGLQLHPVWKGLSPWSRSAVKRLFDCSCVVLSFPVVVPLMLATAIAVWLTSSGPILFLQERVGSNGQTFTIFKFRTMLHIPGAPHHPIATSNEERFTPVGPFLRRWKLDELPQLINVLLGHMSLVGPRPKMREHVVFDLPCRPGITGLASIVFAREDKILDSVAKDRLDAYYHSVVLPAKRQLDAEYMARATFFTDFRLLVNSVLRRWDTAALDEFIVATALDVKDFDVSSLTAIPRRDVVHIPISVRTSRDIETEEVSVS
jgi:lipopolysaccharide/colanic/teichoic acid biosynthesis glycosyltransferase